MASSVLNSDDGVISGTAGLKSSGGDDGVLVFQSKGTETARITATGNVGIGVTPSAWGSPFANVMQFTKGSIACQSNSIQLMNNAFYDGSNYKYVATAGAGFYEQSGGIHLWQSAASGTAGNNITFTERARITSGGYFKATSTGSYSDLARPFHEFRTAAADDWILRLSSTNASPYGLNIQFNGGTPNNNSNEFIVCSDATAGRFEVRSNGGIANYSANNVNLSDRREKTNFAPAKNYLETICAIPVQTFNYIDQNLEDDPGLTLGVVAQDVQEVAPELVMESNWAGKDEEPKMRLSIYQTDLQYALMKCIQELSAKNDALEARLSALEQA
jgi:hypothetical protein